MLISVSSIIRFNDGIIEAIRYANRLGVMHVDVFVAQPHFNYMLNDEEIFHFKRFLEESNIRISLKSPGFAENLASLNPHVRALTLSFFRKLIDLGERLNATHITVKPGMFFFPEKLRKREAYTHLENGIKAVLSYAEEKNTFILFENYYYPIEALRTVKNFLKIIKFAKDFKNYGFAVNIPHLLESNVDINMLIKKSDIIKRIEAVYLGPKPSPWEHNVDYTSISEVISAFKSSLHKIAPRYVILATLRDDILMKMLNQVI